MFPFKQLYVLEMLCFLVFTLIFLPFTLYGFCSGRVDAWAFAVLTGVLGVTSLLLACLASIQEKPKN